MGYRRFPARLGSSCLMLGVLESVLLTACDGGAERTNSGPDFPASGTSAGGAASGPTGEAAAGGLTIAGRGGVSGAAIAGSATGGAGGPPAGGEPSGGGAGAGTGGSGGASSGGAGAGGGAGVVPAVVKVGEGKLGESGLTVVSYGGYLNGESFQQDAILSFNGYQYAAFWNTNRNVVLARRQLPTAPGDAAGPWAKFDFTDYSLSADDAHNTISMGVAPEDGTLHLAFDHHDSALHYRRSVEGLLTDPSVPWAAASFSGVTNALVGTVVIRSVTYPRFVTEPGGRRLLLSARVGASGSGDELLWEYDAGSHGWASLGAYINGSGDSINAYLHGLSYTRGGARLHAAWCWRDTPEPSTNHDLAYAYSDDHGRTWRNSEGTLVGATGSDSITRSTPGLHAWSIGQNRGLINQEHMAVDARGAVHVLLSHLPDGAPDTASFADARTLSEFFHYFRDTDGVWRRNATGLPVVGTFRGKLAISSTNNVYAILPDLRVAGASPIDRYATWSLLDDTDAGRFFSDPLIDTARLESSDALTIYYPERSSVNIWGLEYLVE